GPSRSSAFGSEGRSPAEAGAVHSVRTADNRSTHRRAHRRGALAAVHRRFRDMIQRPLTQRASVAHDSDRGGTTGGIGRFPTRVRSVTPSQVLRQKEGLWEPSRRRTKDPKSTRLYSSHVS